MSWLRVSGAFAALAMCLLVGGVGAERMNAGAILPGLSLLPPLYGLGALCWGLFHARPWALRLFVPGLFAGALVALGVYLPRHHDPAELRAAAILSVLFFGPPLTAFVAQRRAEPRHPIERLLAG